MWGVRESRSGLQAPGKGFRHPAHPPVERLAGVGWSLVLGSGLSSNRGDWGQAQGRAPSLLSVQERWRFLSPALPSLPPPPSAELEGGGTDAGPLEGARGVTAGESLSDPQGDPLRPRARHPPPLRLGFP